MLSSLVTLNLDDDVDTTHWLCLWLYRYRYALPVHYTLHATVSLPSMEQEHSLSRVADSYCVCCYSQYAGNSVRIGKSKRSR